MNKRSAEDTGAEAHAKRARLTKQPDAPAEKIEINSVRQLQHALSFRQDALPELRQGKNFCDA